MVSKGWAVEGSVSSGDYSTRTAATVRCLIRRGGSRILRGRIVRLGLDGLRALGETFICEAGLNVQGYFDGAFHSESWVIDLEGVNGASQAPATCTWR